MRREQQLTRAFAALADTLVDDYDVADLWHSLAQQCVALLDVGAAGLTLADQRGALRVLASSSEQPRLVELFQRDSDEGPGAHCHATRSPVLVPDIAGDAGRWSRFAEAAARNGFRSAHALPVRLRGEPIGALTLFGREAGDLAADDLLLGQALADTATVGLLHERAVRAGEVLAEQLQAALNNRVVIEQAKGILAEHATLDMDQAFTALRAHAHTTGTRLGDVARALVERRLPAATVVPPPPRGA